MACVICPKCGHWQCDGFCPQCMYGLAPAGLSRSDFGLLKEVTALNNELPHCLRGDYDEDEFELGP